MFDNKQRAQLRAALKMWLIVADTSNTHPSTVPAIATEFMLSDTIACTRAEVEALILALETEVIYTTVTLAAAKYFTSKMKLKRQLDLQGSKPVPGSKVYSMFDVIVAVNIIKEREGRGFIR